MMYRINVCIHVELDSLDDFFVCLFTDQNFSSLVIVFYKCVCVCVGDIINPRIDEIKDETSEYYRQKKKYETISVYKFFI